MRKQNEEGRYKGSRIDHSNFVSHDSQEPSGEDMHGEFMEKIITKVQLPPINPLNKLYCSLMSGLRNEIDFGLRVSTILANSKESTWISDFKFIDILIDCVESYSCCCDDENSDLVKQIGDGRVFCNIRVKDEDPNNQQKCNCLQRFWSGLRQDIRVMNLVFGSSCDENGDSYMRTEDDDDFCEDLDYLVDVKKHEPRNHQRIYNLIKNVSEIIRNLSFNIAESPIPNINDESSTSGYSYHFATLNLLKFLVLLISCKDQYYQNLGLDIISNISSHIAINSVNPQYLTFLDLINRYCVNKIISSNDINHINRSLEIICKVVSRYNDEPNEYIATQLFDSEFIQRLTELLTCQHDVSIVISSLDLLLALSESYPKLLVEDSKYLIKILVMLLNCEASQFFSKSALARIKIVDERPKPVELPKTPNQKSTTTATLVTSAVDNETYVVTWLRATFEAKPNQGTLLKLNEIYEDYVRECIRCERKVVIPAQNFAILTKRCFPSITMTGPIIDGLVRRPIKGPGGLSSPILKAQLCAPPKAGSLPPVPNPGTSTSTLIKNLLANKLRTNSGLGSSPSSPSLCASFSSITTGSVTVTPASASPSSSNNNNGNGSKSDTTTTIIPCTINNLNSTFTQQQKPQEPDPDPTDLQPSANKTAFSNSTQSHSRSKDSSSLSSSIPTSVITSITPSQTPASSSHSSSSNSSSSATSNNSNSIIVTSTTLPTSIANSTTSLSTSVTITPAIANTAPPLIPAVSSGASANTQQVFVTANPLTQTSTANILQPQTTCITTGQALQTGSVLFTTPTQPGQTLQPNQPQQFLLVRTIVGNQQQTGLVGMPQGVAGGTPVRLILPPGFLTQQRAVQPTNTTVNGVASVPVAIANQKDSAPRNAISTVLTNSTKAPLTANSSQTIASSTQVSTVSTVTTTAPIVNPSTVSSNSNDILLKAVLGSGIVSENPSGSPNQITNAASNRSNTVKSSPLLNVLLDKGKLPDFSTMAGTINQSNVTNSCVTTITSVTTSSSNSPFNPPILNTSSQTSTPITSMSGSQSNKVYILTTTKSSLPIKNVPNVQQQQSGGQVTSQAVANNLQKSVTVQQLNQTRPVQQTNVIQQPPTTQSLMNSSDIVNSATTVSTVPSSNKLTPFTTESVAAQNTLSGKPIQIDPIEIKSTTISKNELSNGEVSSNLIQVSKSTSKISNDFTVINDIKQVDCATKVVSKRSSEEDDKPQTNKKVKSNNSINSLSITPVKTEIKTELLVDKQANKIKTNGTSVIPSSNAQQGKEVSTSLNSNKSSLAMTDSETNTNPPNAVNGTASTNASVTVQRTTLKSKSTVKSTTVNHKNLQFYCEWHECKKVFSRPSQVYWHVHKEHVNIYGNSSEKMTCKWGGPEGRGPGCLSSRPKLSLLTHINDFHCNAAALQQSAIRRESGVNVPSPVVPPAHPGYASNAALLAIRRHAINYVEVPKPPPITPLTPISTSIRLTAALILRNLAQVSSKLRLLLQSLEPYLSELCMVEGREESRTIAQCLGVITERNDRKRAD
uniref:RFX-type winged-helix domain-containing protein n=2 Tax=Tetranychus urticae TaxID=32264 RepID=T1K5Q4_TETUR